MIKEILAQTCRDKSHLKNEDYVSVSAALSAAGEYLSVTATRSCQQQGSLLPQKLPSLLSEWAQTHQREKRPGDSTYRLIQTPVVKSPHFPLP